MNKKNALVEAAVSLPHPAEDLSADDDLLSWILVDQLGALPNTKLGVHPQQVKFVGPSFKTEEVMNIVKEVSWVGCLRVVDSVLLTMKTYRRLSRDMFNLRCNSCKSKSDLIMTSGSRP